ncbi:MAG: serine protease [Planctomycetes bacterium]|nr:serine protease [Planctomycetota bacterium]
MSRLLLFALIVALAALPAAALSPKADPPAKPWFVDDVKFFGDFMEKLTGLAKDGKCLDREKLTEKMKPGTKAKVALTAKARDKALTPEEIYKVALPSVFIVGSVYKDKEGDWQDGLYATAWVAAADGILVTNWHVFEDLEPEELFGAVDHKGNVYPMIDFLGGDKTADVAIIRIDAKGLTPLPLAEEYATVGSWVGVLGHPGDNFYVYTTGAVTRYSTNKGEDDKRERWMGLTAEYAGGSSGSPVLNRYGAVVGMAALTMTIEDGKKPPMPAPGRRLRRDGPEIAPPPREVPDPKHGHALAVQMILKMAVPGPTIRKSFAK